MKKNRHLDEKFKWETVGMIGGGEVTKAQAEEEYHLSLSLIDR